VIVPGASARKTPRINLLAPGPARGIVYRAEWAPGFGPDDLVPGSLAMRFWVLAISRLVPSIAKERSERARALWRARDGRADKRALGRCEACFWEAGPHGRAIHVHHVRPVHFGRNHRPSNLMALCARCHGIAHSLFGNEDPGDWTRLRLCVVVAFAALDAGRAMSREEIVATVDDVGREMTEEHAQLGWGAP
jgi:hypothetical protein